MTTATSKASPPPPPPLPPLLVEHIATIARREHLTAYTVHYEAGSKHGDGFMSDMLALTVDGRLADGRPQRLDLICKRPPRLQQLDFKAQVVFEREALIYNEILPLLAQVQLQQGIAEADSFNAYPKCFLAQYEPANWTDSMIILQDLRAQRFVLWPKDRITSLANATLLMRQMGRLHGLSFALRDRRPEVYEKLESIPDCLVQVFEGDVEKFFKASYEQAIEMLDEEEDRRVIRWFRDRFMQLLRNAVDLDVVGRSVAVLTHGDCWNNNMMFKLDRNNQAKDICLIDWQITHVCSPALDLTCYIMNTTDKPFRDAHLDELLHVYHAAAAAQIRAFGGDPDQLYPYAALEEQMRRFGYYGTMLTPMALPVLLSAPENISTLEEMSQKSQQTGDQTGGAQMATMTDDVKVLYRQRLKECIRDSRAYGWLDSMDA